MTQQTDESSWQQPHGTVKWYSVEKGYGFIAGDDGVDYFAAARDVEAQRVLKPGDRVAFIVGRHPRGPKAQRVRLSDAAGPARPLTVSEQAAALTLRSRRYERLFRKRFDAKSGSLSSQIASLGTWDWIKMMDATKAVQIDADALTGLLKELAELTRDDQGSARIPHEFELFVSRLDTVFEIVNQCDECKGKGTTLKGLFFPEEVPCIRCNGFGKFVKP